MLDFRQIVVEYGQKIAKISVFLHNLSPLKLHLSVVYNTPNIHNHRSPSFLC